MRENYFQWSNIQWGILGSTFALLIVTLYLMIADNIYLASSRAVIFRNKIENPDDANDEARNRWIWARDGLNISSALVTDDLIESFRQKALETGWGDTVGNSDTLGQLRAAIKIHYTGADENNFLIEVRHHNSHLAVELNRHILAFLEYLAVGKDEQDYKNVLQEFSSQLAHFPESSPEHSYYRNKIIKLKFDQTLSQVQKRVGFRIISNPQLEKTPIWPRPIPLLILAVFLGFFLGNFGRLAVRLSEKIK